MARPRVVYLSAGPPADAVDSKSTPGNRVPVRVPAIGNPRYLWFYRVLTFALFSARLSAIDGPQLTSANKSFSASGPDELVSISVMHSFRKNKFLFGSREGHIAKCELSDKVISIIAIKEVGSRVTCLDALTLAKRHSLVVAGCESGDVFLWSKNEIELKLKMYAEVAAIHVSDTKDITVLSRNGVLRRKTAIGANFYAPSIQVEIHSACFLNQRAAFCGHDELTGLRSYCQKQPFKKIPPLDMGITALVVGSQTGNMRSLICGSHDGDIFLYFWTKDLYERGRKISLYKKGAPRSRERIKSLTLLDGGSLLVSANDRKITLWQRDTNDFSYHPCAKEQVGVKGDPIIDLAAISQYTFAVGFYSGIIRTFRIDGLASSSPKATDADVAELIEALGELQLREIPA